MTWTDVRNALQDRKFEITVTGAGKRDWTLSADPGDPAGPVAQTFTTLGAGTNKMAVQVDGTNWVLLFGKTGRAVEASSFAEEVRELETLAQRVRVPEPFATGGRATYLFHITVYNDGDENRVPAFLQELMAPAHFVEMTKTTPRARDEFARHHIVPNGRVPSTIARTLADLATIKAAFDLAPWGDFQVMYEKLTGRLYVFDPLASDPNAAAYRASMDAWKADIEAAQERERATTHAATQASIKYANDAATKGAAGGLPRRKSIG